LGEGGGGGENLLWRRRNGGGKRDIFFVGGKYTSTSLVKEENPSLNAGGGFQAGGEGMEDNGVNRRGKKKKGEEA